MKRSILIVTTAVLTFAVSGYGDVPPEPLPRIAAAPLGISFERFCDPPKGQPYRYDPETGVFDITLVMTGTGDKPSGFAVTKAASKEGKPIVFRLTGVPAWYGLSGTPLSLSVGGSRYVIDEGCDYYYREGIHDKTLFRVTREGELVTVEFTPKGRSLLIPGAKISFVWHHDW